MIKIKRDGIVRACTLKQYEDKFKRLGYEIIDKPKKDTPKVIDVEKYFKGGGWYEYQGESYRKAELLEKLGDIA